MHADRTAVMNTRVSDVTALEILDSRANAIVGVSMAVARAMAAISGQPLYRWLGEPGFEARLPAPHLNVINGGAHAQNPAFQEFMLAPLGAPEFAAAVRAGGEIYSRLRALLRDRALSTGLNQIGTVTETLDAMRVCRQAG